MRKKLTVALIIGGYLLSGTISSLHAFDQEGRDHRCSLPEARQFDFWIGEWSLEWTGEDGETLEGTNLIRTLLSGCVIEEQFKALKSQFQGMSVSSYNPTWGKWQQTWVDNQQNYLDFVGEFKDGKMVLERNTQVDGKDIVQRMVWYNISADELDWNWERSDDNGKSWTILWKIHYTRKN